ncbi:MAG: alpha/beta hydrolase [Rhodospirillales bacterium]|nr:alpha/beta hydrolase [Rhodospirillales bacterium]
MLYRGMDRAQLDTAYNNLAAVPAHPKLFADWARRSARFRGWHHGYLNLAYGERPRERLDLFLAANPAAPTLAYIHGGYWQMPFQTKETYSTLAEGALSHGLNVAMVEYTLAPEARMDLIVDEVHQAIGWLHEHLGDYGADGERLYVAGHSAGGHLTAMAMPLSAVKGGIAISGVYDLEPIRLNCLNEKLGLNEAEARRNSPMRNFPPSAAPLIVACGTAELPELRRQSTGYAEAWAEHGLPGHLLAIDGADHFTILETLAQPDGALMQALLTLARG